MCDLKVNEINIHVSTRLKCNRHCLVNMTLPKTIKELFFMNRQMCWLICCSLVCFALYVFDDAWNLKLVMYWYMYIFYREKNVKHCWRWIEFRKVFLVLSILILMDQNLTFPRNKYFSVVRKTPWNLIMDWYIVCTVILWIIHSSAKSVYEINVTLRSHLRDCVSLFEVKKIRFLQLRTEFFFYFKLTEKTFRPSVAENSRTVAGEIFNAIITNKIQPELSN